MVPSDGNKPDSFDSFYSLWPGANPEEKNEDYACSHQPFSKMFLIGMCRIPDIYPALFAVSDIRPDTGYFQSSRKLRR